MMTQVEDLAQWVTSRSYADLSKDAVLQLKIRVLDSLGCAIGAVSGPPVKLVRMVEQELGGNPLCTMIGGGKTSPDRAAFYNGALIRYLDYNDSFLGKGETCHPSDNVAPILASAEFANSSGKDFLVALAIAYQVQCRLSEVAPVRAKGFDHTTQGAYAVAAGSSKALRLDSSKTANAIAISGTMLNALRVTRTGKLSHWKGLAYPYDSFCSVNAVFLARKGITGPLEVFEGNKGFMDSIAGHFEINWNKENLEAVTRTIVKRYNAEVHSQSCIECILAMRSQDGLLAKDVKSIDVKIFDVAHNIIGGGEEGEKKSIRTKEEADHSLPYILSVALLDGEVTPKQYLPRRIMKDDVQTLLQKVNISPDKEFSTMFPNKMPCKITVTKIDGKTIIRETEDYEGFFTRPITWMGIVDKFTTLALPHTRERLMAKIIDTVQDMEKFKIRELMRLLTSV